MDSTSDTVNQQSALQDEVLMDKPQVPAGCPPGLEYLTMIDQLICKQVTHLLEVLCPWEKNNVFHVYNSMNQQVYTATEETSCAMRWFCGYGRGFIYSVKDNYGKEVLTLVRKFKCCAGCCWCADSEACGWELEVWATGERLGVVRQIKSCWKPYMYVKLDEGGDVGEFRGPCCVISCSGCCGDVEFPLYSPDSKVIGKVSKQWSGAAREFCTDSDNYSITFPVDMDVKAKACIFAAVFLVDMMFFEQNRANWGS